MARSTAQSLDQKASSKRYAAKREDFTAQDSISAAIFEASRRNDPAQRVVRLVTSNPKSAVFIEAWTALRELNEQNIEMRVVFTDLKTKDGIDLFAGLASLYGLRAANSSVRCSHLPSRRELSEQLIVGERDVWHGRKIEEKRLKPCKHSTLSEREIEDTIEHFEFIWEMSEPLADSVVKKGARKALKQIA